jgi:CPA1 family monovalent cation:H+ antiporter
VIGLFHTFVSASVLWISSTGTALASSSAGVSTRSPIGFDSAHFLALLLVASLVALAGQRFRLSYSLSLVLVGLALGLAHVLPNVSLEPHTLFTLFLPPLLFEAALKLDTGELRRDGLPIGLLALGGTLVSCLLIAALVSWFLGLPWPVALVFGALISPTDPISVIAVLRQNGVNHRLALIIESESLFNDGVAVVLFTVLLGLALGHTTSLLDGVVKFCVVVIGGTAIGAGIGAAASWLTHAFDDPLPELMLTTVVAFGAYLLADACGMSGVIAVVAAGIVVGNFGMTSGMSPGTRGIVMAFWEFAAYVANSIVFLLIGVQAVLVQWWGHLEVVAVCSAIVIGTRVAVVYPLAELSKRLGTRLPLAWQHLLVVGSLRGALSMALALGLPTEFPQRSLVVSLTFGYVLVSLLLQGPLVGPLIRSLKLSGAPVTPDQN